MLLPVAWPSKTCVAANPALSAHPRLQETKKGEDQKRSTEDQYKLGKEE